MSNVTWKPAWTCLHLKIGESVFELDIDGRGTRENEVTLRHGDGSGGEILEGSADDLEKLGRALIEAAELVRSGKYKGDPYE